MKSMFCTQLALLVVICIARAQTTGQDVRKLTPSGQNSYADNDGELYLGASDVSPVNGHVFQAVLLKCDDAKPVYDYYFWELNPDGEKVQERLVRAGITTPFHIPHDALPALQVLPDGNILSIIGEPLRNPQIVRFDVSKGMIFREPLPNDKDLSSHFKSIIPAGDGQAFVIGSVRGQPTIVKTDEQGQILFEKEIAVEGSTGICSEGVQLSDNRFRICGVSHDRDSLRSGEGIRLWVVDVDSQGDVQGKFVIDNAPWVSLPSNLRIARLGPNRTAFVHPVMADGRTLCHVTVLDDVLKPIAETSLCEVPGYVGEFHVQRYGDGLVIAVHSDPHVQSGPQKIAVYVVDGNLTTKAKGVAEPLSPNVLWTYRLAVTGDRALIVAQRGWPLKKETNTLDFTVFGLKDTRER